MMITHNSIRTSDYLLPFLFVLLVPSILSHSFGKTRVPNHNNIRCISKEREALLKFKREIQVDYCGLLSSWGDQDCCQWHGVLCSNRTGHVVMLDLSGRDVVYDHCLKGKVSASLLELKHLNHLDLSFNKFQGQLIPGFLGSLINLKRLYLSSSGFEGKIPEELGNLSRLTSLDLSVNKVHADSLNWLSRLTLLQDINLSNSILSKARDWFQTVNNLRFLKVLQIDRCLLPPSVPSSLSYINTSMSLRVLTLAHNGFSDSSIFRWLFNLSGISTHLVHLDLSDNSIPGPIPSCFRYMHFLQYLNLSSNALEGFIPNYFSNMTSVSHLDLYANALEGPIPSGLGNMHLLSYLDLSGNALGGRIPDTISSLKHLVHLDLSWNNFQGSVPKNLGDLCSLDFLELSYNNLSDKLESIAQTLCRCAHKSLVFLNLAHNQVQGSIPDTISTFSSLRYLYLDDNQLNGKVSQGIGHLSRLETLSFSSNSLKDTLFHSHFSNLSRLRNLDLSNNVEMLLNISPNWIPPFQLETVYLSSCKLGPCFPKWLETQTNISWMDVSSAGISDTVPATFWNSLSSKLESLNMSQNKLHGVLPSLSITFDELPEIDLSWNSIEGDIPSFRGKISSLFLNDNMFSDPLPFLCPQTKMILSTLDLSNNFLSGEIPDCWMFFDQLSVLRLENNSFVGKLPASMGALKQLQVLHLRNNSLSGEFPVSLENCTSLVLLDVAYNSLRGYIPPGIGYNLRSLGMLSLRNNDLYGVIPSSLCRLAHLQILDVSGNHVSGSIPKCIYNLTAMSSTKNHLPEILYQYGFYAELEYYDAAFVMWKRKEQPFRYSLGEVKFFHISDNALEGQIPDGISSLAGLISLDLSRNNLNGSITPNIGQLTPLEFLDLSSNHLSGKIPASLANLNFLGMLNLSYNNLSGKIPAGTLLQGFDASAYTGNVKLCGPPLATCTRGSPVTNTSTGQQNITQQQDDDSDDIFPGLYISVVLGFITGFWGVFGTLVLNTSWRNAFFQFLDDTKDRFYVLVAVKIGRVWKP